MRGGRGQGDEEVRQNLHRGQGSEEEEGRSGARISIGRGRSVLGTMLNVHRYIFQNANGTERFSAMAQLFRWVP